LAKIIGKLQITDRGGIKGLKVDIFRRSIEGNEQTPQGIRIIVVIHDF
jgi:hypothetical protein